MNAGKMVLKQMVCDNRAFPAGTSCCAMALSSYYLFVADSKGSLYILRCDIKNGMLLVCHGSLITNTYLSHTAIFRPALGLRFYFLYCIISSCMLLYT